MRIAIVHSFYSERETSGEKEIVNAQANLLRNRGHDVEVVGEYTDILSKDSSYSTRTAINVALPQGKSPIARLQAFNPDIVHVHDLFPNFSRSWLKHWRGPSAATLRNFRPVCATATLYRAGAICMECVDFGSQRAVKHKCYRGSRLAAIPLAIQMRHGVKAHPALSRADRIIVLAKRSRQIHSGLVIPDSKKTFLPDSVDAPEAIEARPGAYWIYVGRLTREKGILALLQSWPENEDLLIVGDGPLRDAVDQLVRSRATRNIRNVGAVQRSQVQGLMAASKGLLFSGEWPEGAPLVYVEALATGRPVIARSGNSVADDADRNGAGVVYSSTPGLLAALDRAKSNWTAFSDAVRQRFDEAFASKSWVNKLENLYRGG